MSVPLTMSLITCVNDPAATSIVRPELACAVMFILLSGSGEVTTVQAHQPHRDRISTDQRGAVPGGAAAGGGDAQGFHDSKVVRDTDHINEHLQGKAAVNISEMSLEELEFHYFKMHDFDNNTKLDGLEIFKALTHLLPYEDLDAADEGEIDTRGKSPDEVARERRDHELRYYTEIVDNVLRDDDIDNDGYLTYPEYIIARRREEAREMREQRDAGANSDSSSSSSQKRSASSHRHH